MSVAASSCTCTQVVGDMNVASFILYTEGKLNLLCIVIIIISGACVSECVHVCYIVLICACSCLQCMCGSGIIWCTSGGSYVRYVMLSVGID